MAELVSENVKVEDVVMTVDVIFSELICSVDVDVASVDTLRLVDSAVEVGAVFPMSVIKVSSIGSVGGSSVSALGEGDSLPSGPSRNGVPALRLI